MIPILPRSYIKYNSQGEVYTGLSMQYHYIGLDQIPMDIDSTVAGVVAAIYLHAQEIISQRMANLAQLKVP